MLLFHQFRKLLVPPPSPFLSSNTPSVPTHIHIFLNKNNHSNPFIYLFNIPRFISHQNSSRLHTFISFRDIPSQFLIFHLKVTETIRRNGYKVSPSKWKVKICLLYRILIFYFWKVPSNVVHKTLDTEEPLFSDCLRIDEGHSSMDNLDCSVEVNWISFAATSARFECPEESNWFLILHNTQVSPIRTPILRVCYSAFYEHDQLITGYL